MASRNHLKPEASKFNVFWMLLQTDVFWYQSLYQNLVYQLLFNLSTEKQGAIPLCITQATEERVGTLVYSIIYTRWSTSLDE